MALGAATADVLRMVLRQGLLQVAIGIVLGVGLAALLSTAMRARMFDVSPHDPMTFTGIAVVLALTGLLACLVPARRAALVDPMEALRVQ
jgi:ABC-type lipoprotein release transport system permease subunit